MADSNLFARLAELEAQLGADELARRLAAVDADVRGESSPRERARRRSDGQAYGEFKRRRKRGVDGWWYRAQINGVRRDFWARTKDELRDLIADAQAGNAKLSARRRVEKQPPATPGEARERFLRVYPEGASKRALEDRLAVILDTPIVELSGRRIAELPYGSFDDEEFALLVNQLAETPRARTGRPYAAGSMRGYLKAARQLGTWVERRFGEQNWARLVPLPDPTKSADPLVSWEEVFALADAFSALGHPAYNRLVRFACGCGARPEEWLVARDCDYDRKEGTFTFRRALVSTSRGLEEVEQLKTEEAAATIILPDVALEALEELPQSLRRDPADWRRSPLLFPDWRFGDQPIDLQAFRRLSYETSRSRRDGSQIVKAAGPWTLAFELAGLRRRPPRQMRHTFAFLALQAGVPREDVALMLRHKDGNTEMVERHYAHLVPKMARRSIEAMNLETPRYSLRTGQAL